MKGVKNWWFFVHWFIKFMTSRERQWAPAIRPGRWASFQVANEVLRHWLCTAKSCEKPWKNLPRLWYWGIGGKKCDHFGRKSNTTGKHGPVTVHPQLTALLSQTQQFSVFLWKKLAWAWNHGLSPIHGRFNKQHDDSTANGFFPI